MEDVLLSVSTAPEIDLDIFACWIEGKPIDEAVKFKLKNGFQGLEFPRPNENINYDPNEFMKLEVYDQYRLFHVIEHYLSIPSLLKSQTICIIPLELQSVLIERYWSLDDIFVRELLNKKILKSRKDLEDASEVSGLNLRRVTRQFDNIKRIYSAFEDSTNQIGNLYTYLTKTYLMPSNLAKRYAFINFLVYSKFNLTNKKRILRVSCESLECCAALIQTFLILENNIFFKALSREVPSELSLLESNQLCWNFVWKVFHLVDGTELDKQLTSSLRDLRGIISGENLDNATSVVKSKLNNTLIRKIEGSSATATSRLRGIIKSLLQLGANLSQSREYRDLFEDIISKVAEPLEDFLSVSEINMLLISCYHIVSDFSDSGRTYSLAKSEVSTKTDSSSVLTGRYANPKGEILKRDWLRFITFCRLCLLQLISNDRRSIT